MQYTLGKLADQCQSIESQVSPTVRNVTGGVDVTYGNERLYNCALNGANVGVMRTTQVIEAAPGGQLETHVAEGTYSKVTSALSFTGAGELSVEDNWGGPLG